MPPEPEERLEPPGAAAIASGADQAGVRVYNERLILSLVRRYRQLSKIEVARLTGLSVQSASAIMNRLQLDGLLRREAPQRGRVGQPTVPLSLDPQGAFSLGLKIGRRSCELVLVDFEGRVRRARPGNFRLADAAIDSRICGAHAAPVHPDAVAEAASPRGGPGDRGAVSIVELGRGDRRAARRDGRMANHRHRAGDRPSLLVPGDPVQRRDLGLRGGVLLRPGMAPSRLSVFLSRIVRGRRPRASAARCFRAAPETPARSARCRSRARRASLRRS